MPIQRGFYRHFKGMPYRVLGVARHSETLEELVLYETLYENPRGRTWVRPLEMFNESVSVPGSEGPSVRRFQPIDFTIRMDFSPMDASVLNFIRSIFPSLDVGDYRSKLETTENHLCLAALDRERLVGFKLGHAWPQGFYSWLGGVAPEYRGLGVGSLLMETMKEWCRTRRYVEIHTKTMNQFPEMIRLNLKHGFDVIGTETNAQGELKILMRCDLSKTERILHRTCRKGV